YTAEGMRGSRTLANVRYLAVSGCLVESPFESQKGVFQSSCLLGVRLVRYPAVINASGHRFSGNLASIRIARALLISVAPDRSADPFCAGVYGGEVSTVIPSS